MSRSPDGFVGCSDGDDAPQVCHRSKRSTRTWRRQLRHVLRVHQRHLGADVPLYLTGSVALQQAIAPREQWRAPDLDLTAPDTSPQKVPERIAAARAACAELRGRFTALRYVVPSASSPTMRWVLAKTVCERTTGPSAFDALPPRVGVVFTQWPVLRGAKSPSVVAFAASDLSTAFVPDNRWMRCLRARRLPWVSRETEVERREAAHKYGPRGFANERVRRRDGAICDATSAVQVRHTAPITDRSPSAAGLLRTVNEEQWRATVTSKIHYRVGAAWVRVRCAESVALAVGGSFLALRHARTPWARTLGAIVATTSAAVLAERPSAVAQRHQRAGAAYAALEREWARLRGRLHERRVRLDWAEAEAVDLQRRKALVDRRSPNAPGGWWKRSVLAEVAHKKANPDP
jgi:hypothetical protein